MKRRVVLINNGNNATFLINLSDVEQFAITQSHYMLMTVGIYLSLAL